MKLTNNFNLSEFTSHDGAAFPPEVIVNLTKLAKNLQVIRDHTGKSVTVNSGYRSPAHNKKIGGVANSQHVLGKAADITITGLTPPMVKELLENLIKAGKIINGGIGLYPAFVHYDIRNKSARW